MKRILIISSSFDKTVDYFIEKYGNKRFIRLNVDELKINQISITNVPYFKVSIENDKYDIENLFDSISSIYYRKLFLPELQEYNAKYHTYMQKEIYGFITGLVDSFEGRILTSPSILRKVENKVFQLKIAMELNFLFPYSLITNNKNLVNTLQSKIIAKPISTGKLTKESAVHTSIVTKQVDNLELSPTYFQEYIEKDYELRITVVKEEFYCVKIVAENKIDWRSNEAKNHYVLIETPEIVKHQCLKFLKACDLEFGAFDYIVRNEEYYFLECNPNGQWLWLEQELGLDISNSIMRLLND